MISTRFMLANLPDPVRALCLLGLMVCCISALGAEDDQTTFLAPGIELEWSDELDGGMEQWRVIAGVPNRAESPRSLISLDPQGVPISHHLAVYTHEEIRWNFAGYEKGASASLIRNWVSEDGHWKLEQWLQSGDQPYRVDLTLTLTRLQGESDQVTDPEPVLSIGPGLGEEPIAGLGIATSLYSYVEPVIERAGETVRVRLADRDDVYSSDEAFTRAGLSSRYFALVLTPAPGTRTGAITSELADSPDPEFLAERYLPTMRFQLDGVPAGVGESTSWHFEIFSGPKSRRALAAEAEASDYTGLLFHGLWRWMRGLSFGLLYVLEWIYLVVPSWGLAICLLAVLVRILLYPMARWALSSQQKFAEVQREIQPEMARIKKKYRGGEQSERILKLYERHGVSPLAGLKPLLIVLVQIPIFVALFHVLGQAFELRDASFLWMDSLAKPDQLFSFGIDLPFFGGYFNLLPVLMAITTLMTIKLSPAPASSDAERRRQNIFLGLMALAFFLLFYPFPSGMVLYWTMANVLHILQARLTGPPAGGAGGQKPQQHGHSGG